MKTSTVAYLVWIFFLLATLFGVIWTFWGMQTGIIVSNVWLATFFILRELERRLPW